MASAENSAQSPRLAQRSRSRARRAAAGTAGAGCASATLGDARAAGEAESAAAGLRTASSPGSCQPGLALQGRPRQLVPLLPGEEHRAPQQPRAAPSPEESRGDAGREEQVLFRPILLTFVTSAAHGERCVSPVCYHSLLIRSKLLNFFKSKTRCTL